MQYFRGNNPVNGLYLFILVLLDDMRYIYTPLNIVCQAFSFSYFQPRCMQGIAPL